MININTLKKQIEKIAITQSALSPYEKRINKIKSSAASTTTLEISYLDQKNIKTKRVVEPYKLTDNDFWGYDTTKEQIRRFKTKNIKGIKSSKKSFQPRWEIEI